MPPGTEDHREVRWGRSRTLKANKQPNKNVSRWWGWGWRYMKVTFSLPHCHCWWSSCPTWGPYTGTCICSVARSKLNKVTIIGSIGWPSTMVKNEVRTHLKQVECVWNIQSYKVCELSLNWTGAPWFSLWTEFELIDHLIGFNFFLVLQHFLVWWD